MIKRNHDPASHRYISDSRLVLKKIKSQCTNGFCLQIKGENVRIKARRLKHPYEAQGILILLNKCHSPLYFILTASNAILSGVYLLPHYISISMYSACIDFGELAMLEVITAKRS